MRNITVHPSYSERSTSSGNVQQYGFQPSDMIGSYRWPNNLRNAPARAEDPENVVLNRSDGFDMLSFIIECADKWNWDASDRNSCLKLERLILFNVPDEFMTRIQVRSWIEKHFSVKNAMA